MNDLELSPDELLEDKLLIEALDNEEEEFDESDDDIIANFTNHLDLMSSKWDPIYKEMETDWDFYTLDQWSEDAKRTRNNKVRVTIDISRKFVKSVVSETFRNPPAIKLTARNVSANDKSKYISDALRYIEDRTGAIYAYSYAKECAARLWYWVDSCNISS